MWFTHPLANNVSNFHIAHTNAHTNQPSCFPTGQRAHIVSHTLAPYYCTADQPSCFPTDECSDRIDKLQRDSDVRLTRPRRDVLQQLWLLRHNIGVLRHRLCQWAVQLVRCSINDTADFRIDKLQRDSDVRLTRPRRYVLQRLWLLWHDIGILWHRMCQWAMH
jgi:hypothetical protein